MLAGSVLVLADLMVILMIAPIRLIFGTSGLLVFNLVLLAMTVICLERSLTLRDPDMVRAWWGILGGMAAWVVVELNNSLGNQPITSITGMLSLLLVVLVASVIWRRIAPLGLRYYILLFFLGWIGHVALVSLSFLEAMILEIKILLPIIGYLAGATIVITLVYIFFRSQTRLERLNAAITIWLASMILIYVVRGVFF